jgi:phosphocarrier protein
MSRLNGQMAMTNNETILPAGNQVAGGGVAKQMAEQDADNTIVTKEVQIINKMGLHARPAMQFVDLSNKFTSRITVCKNNKPCVNAKSIMELLLLAAAAGTKLVIQAQGADAHQAVDALAKLVESKFGEE